MTFAAWSGSSRASRSNPTATAAASSPSANVWDRMMGVRTMPG
jgi:hypothetical protein